MSQNERKEAASSYPLATSGSLNQPPLVEHFAQQAGIIVIPVKYQWIAVHRRHFDEAKTLAGDHLDGLAGGGGHGTVHVSLGHKTAPLKPGNEKRPGD